MKFSHLVRLGILGFALAIGCVACTSHKEAKDEAAFQIEPDRIKVNSSSNLLHHLNILPVESYNGSSVAYQSIGKMIALSSESNDLTGPKTSWVELDPETTREAHLTLVPEPVGSAYAVTTISTDFLNQIRPHQSVHVRHYKVAEAGWDATIYRVLPSQDSGIADVVVHLSEGHDLYPGTNCEITFPLLRVQAVKIPAEAVIHDGVDDYVWQELSPGEYSPKKVTLASGTADEVIVSSGVTSNTRIVGKGAILLKPELRPILKLKKEQEHAHPVDRSST